MRPGDYPGAYAGDRPLARLVLAERKLAILVRSEAIVRAASTALAAVGVSCRQAFEEFGRAIAAAARSRGWRAPARSEQWRQNAARYARRHRYPFQGAAR